MEYIFFNKENIFFEDGISPSTKILEKDLLKYLDLPVMSTNLYVDHFFVLLEKMGTHDLDIIFKSSLNGYKLEGILKELKDISENPLSINNKVEISWYISTEHEERSQKDNIKDFVRARGWDGDDYFAISKYSLTEIRSLLITTNTRYLIEDSSGEIKFNGTKNITLRMLIDSILDEITINKNNIKRIESGLKGYKMLENNKNIISKAKIRLIHLQQELDENLTDENFEICADIRDEIEKCNKLIRNGK